MFTISEKQDRAIVDLHNQAANQGNQVDYGMAWAIADTDNFAADLLASGVASVELRGYETKSNNPTTLNITIDMIDVDHETIAEFVKESVDAGEDMAAIKTNFAAVWGSIAPII